MTISPLARFHENFLRGRGVEKNFRQKISAYIALNQIVQKGFYRTPSFCPGATSINWFVQFGPFGCRFTPVQNSRISSTNFFGRGRDRNSLSRFCDWRESRPILSRSRI